MLGCALLTLKLSQENTVQAALPIHQGPSKAVGLLGRRALAWCGYESLLCLSFSSDLVQIPSLPALLLSHLLEGRQ